MFVNEDPKQFLENIRVNNSSFACYDTISIGVVGRILKNVEFFRFVATSERKSYLVFTTNFGHLNFSKLTNFAIVKH